eukprot:NODE_63_length_2933_cov_64.667142_g59_i0.p1 GENE.NODE_63_length_2933_cov_64.667142_g59_i0~~NODE_63_length_2933_cov_64.667142_g59_i0.p1  ORF type:complete len:288 (-),score=49.54 NODE_63_length_2933_cov_64.667142_g59_i0:598-1461(-)
MDATTQTALGNVCCNGILQHGVKDFYPHVFDLLAYVVHSRRMDTEQFWSLVPAACSADVLTVPGVAPNVAKFVSALLCTPHQLTVTDVQCATTCATHLLRAQHADDAAVSLSYVLMIQCPAEACGGILATMLPALCWRLHEHSTRAVLRAAALLLAMAVARTNAELVHRVAESVRSGLFEQLCTSAWAPACRLLQENAEKALSGVTITRVLQWPKLSVSEPCKHALQTAVEQLQSSKDVDDQEDEDDEAAYRAHQYTPLASCSFPEPDYITEFVARADPAERAPLAV